MTGKGPLFLGRAPLSQLLLGFTDPLSPDRPAIQENLDVRVCDRLSQLYITLPAKQDVFLVYDAILLNWGQKTTFKSLIQIGHLF